MKKTKKVTTTEKVLERPNLVIGPTTGNIGLRKGNWATYVKIVTTVYAGMHLPDHFKVGNTAPLNDGIEYTGPIDDEMMANILIYGG